MRTLDQGETAAVERQHPPIGPTQPVALLDLRIAKAGFAGDPRADLCKFGALQGLQQIARIGDATALLASESLIEQHFRRARSAAPVSDPIPVGAIVSGALATRCRSNHVAPTAFGNASRFCHDSTVPTLQPVRLLETRRAIEMIRPDPPCPIGQPFGQALPPHRLEPADVSLDKFS